MEYVRTDNGFEFTNRFSNSKRNLPFLFENTAVALDIQHKLIRPYAPRHNSKVERSHREDQKRFYSSHSFFSLVDFDAQLVQVFTPIFEEQFHDHSYGFRLNRCAQQAVLKALEMMNDGHSWIVDIDLAKFFDIVNHDKPMTIFR